jgi:arginyl-tRNA synthetase
MVGAWRLHRYDHFPVMNKTQETITDAVEASLAAAVAAGAVGKLDAVQFVVERPRDRAHGDWATNAALVASKQAGIPPRDLATLIIEHLPDVEYLASTDIAGPGFINFTLDPGWYLEALRTAALGGSDHARGVAGSKERVQVEFVSSNPNGPLHIGHGRGGVIGDVIARSLEYAGHPVSREYYYNDAGVQMDRYAASLEALYLEMNGVAAEFPEDGYHGAYVHEWATEMNAEVGASLVEAADRRDQIRQWGLVRAMRDIEETLELARIPFDVWFSEKTLHDSGAVDRSIASLRERGHVYDSEGAVWFRTTEFGDEKDRVLVKTDGAYTYISPDVAYHDDKFQRGFERVINVWGADHHGYVVRMKSAIEALGYDPDRLEIVINQMVNLSRGGDPMRMSMRAGEFVSFREVLEEVGTDATRYHLAAFSPDTTINFDLEIAKAQSMDNPVYYLQYAHARMCSLEGFAAAEGIVRSELETVDLSVLDHAAERALLLEIDRLGEEIAEAAARRAPHRVTTYGTAFATAFHRFYNECRVVTDDPAVTQARLWLIAASKNVILAVLGVLGLSAPESM